uniref:Ovule protein n=1 Tax=Steinernema glaseri TaxID=37863 RepID=A0A1I7ZCX6_9BILA
MPVEVDAAENWIGSNEVDEVCDGNEENNNQIMPVEVDAAEWSENWIRSNEVGEVCDGNEVFSRLLGKVLRVSSNWFFGSTIAP